MHLVFFRFFFEYSKAHKFKMYDKILIKHFCEYEDLNIHGIKNEGGIFTKFT